MNTGTDAQFLNRLRSPFNGRPLRRCADQILTDGTEEWPYLDGIPYLRTGRDRLRGQALQLLKQGDELGALALLLTDRRDDRIPPLDTADAKRAITAAGNIGKAMDYLGYGLMASYVFHRWCLPTFLSGLALLELHGPRGATMFDAGCGAGHFLRRWMDRSGRAIGADLVFSNLWLARRFVAPGADLVCCDLEEGIPMEPASADFSFAHDAFHYFGDKYLILSEMRRVARSGNALLGHVHNAGQENFSPGDPLPIEEYRACVDPDRSYDDAQLAEALRLSLPRSALREASSSAQAFAFVCGDMSDYPLSDLFMPKPGRPLRLNPLLHEDGPRWPNPKFKREFADCWDYMQGLRHPGTAAVAAAQSRGADASEEIARLARDQVFLELPENWE